MSYGPPHVNGGIGLEFSKTLKSLFLQITKVYVYNGVAITWTKILNSKSKIQINSYLVMFIQEGVEIHNVGGFMDSQ